ncbi:class F sortase [Terrabacter carboxydivorans]|uniref:Sortase family protein n=1 Tax=Terrabacter carboxydivorans TaxID=619730 RepID=A0ABP5ZRT5_9MICO
MPESTPKQASRRVTTGVAAAAVATAVLLAVGILALVLGLQGTSVPSHSATGQGLDPSANQPGASASAGANGTPAHSPTTPANPSNSTAPDAGSDQDTTGGTIGDFLPASEPTAIDIPAIGVHSTRFVPLKIQRDGTLSVPPTAQEVGLYDDGPTPGQLGPAVLAAHVDTPDGVPGIFAKLREVKTGDLVKVTRRDGTRLTFTVDRVAAFQKTQFPTHQVYDGDFAHAEIRLVTCGGPTDNRNEYRDNVIVFGHLTSS